MGDHRADIKIEFTIHQKTYKTHIGLMGGINWFDNGNGIDQRVVDWFSECWDDARGRYEEEIAESYRKEHAAETEAQERRQLAQLKAKYERDSTTQA